MGSLVGHRVVAKAKIKLFRNMVMLHIKLKGTTRTVTWQQIFACRHTLDPWGGVKPSKHFFLSESCHVAYQVKGRGA